MKTKVEYSHSVSDKGVCSDVKSLVNNRPWHHRKVINAGFTNELITYDFADGFQESYIYDHGQGKWVVLFKTSSASQKPR